MERWREFFESSGVDFWTICERALALAYLDNPPDFPLHRDRLAQKLYAPEKLDLQLSDEHAPSSVTNKHQSVDEEGKGNHRIDDSSDDNEYDDRIVHSPSNGNYDEAEALTEEMEEENLFKRDVFEIKDTLLDTYKSEREIFDSLQRLELMELSFDVLKETEIGKVVNSLRKHSSARIRALVKKLVSEWKDTADHWYKSVEDVTAAARAGPLSAESPLHEDGLPSPPMDEGALLAGRTASIEMSQLFDFMEDETPAGSRRCSDASGSGSLKKSNGHADLSADDKKGELVGDAMGKKKGSDVKKKDRDSITSSNGHSKRDRDEYATNGHANRRISIEKAEKKVQRTETSSAGAINKAQASSRSIQDSPELDEKLEAAKRKLHENYQQAEIAKRQRTIRVMELEDLPKGGPKRANKTSQMSRGKPLSQHRGQAFVRR